MRYAWTGVAAAAILIAGGTLSVLLWAPVDIQDHDVRAFLISDRDQATGIAQRLKDQGLLRNAKVFLLMARITGADRQLHRGYFFLRPDMNMLEVMNLLQEKQGSARMVRVTLPEGLTLQQIAQRLEVAHVLPATEFLKTAQSEPSALVCEAFPFVQGRPNLEGFLFPDTYVFAPGVPAEQVIFAMLENFDRQIMQAWRSNLEIDATDFYDTLILASVVEKEAATANEMPEIAGVFRRRLRLGIPMEADPTVRYALGNPDTTGVSWDDLKVDSPYNTYRRLGLPPTPICAPGLLAFKAAMRPHKTYNLYFIAKNDGSGTHDFSATLREHNNKRTRYRYEHR